VSPNSFIANKFGSFEREQFNVETERPGGTEGMVMVCINHARPLPSFLSFPSCEIDRIGRIRKIVIINVVEKSV
jgi:hypothetical protein